MKYRSSESSRSSASSQSSGTPWVPPPPRPSPMPSVLTVTVENGVVKFFYGGQQVVITCDGKPVEFRV